MTKPSISYTINVQIDLKDDTHVRFAVQFGETIPQALERNPLYVTHTFLVRTGGPAVRGKLMSYGHEETRTVRIVDIHSSLNEFLAVAPNEESQEPFFIGVGDCSNLRTNP